LAAAASAWPALGSMLTTSSSNALPGLRSNGSSAPKRPASVTPQMFWQSKSTGASSTGFSPR
jgi:hypothetical protein